MLATFVGVMVSVLIERKPAQFNLSTFLTAGEVASWRVKWAAIPISIAVLWMSARIVRSIRQNPSRFSGLRAARSGLTAATMITLLIATLIGITIPERLRQRRDSLEAAIHARGYALHRAFLEYRELHGTFPTDPDKYVEALRTLPDPDGSIADALRFADPSGYQASAQLAAASTKVKPMVARGGALRNASATTNPEAPGVSFTTYELRLPSEHRLLGSDDDFILRDGVIYKASDLNSTSSTSTRTP